MFDRVGIFFLPKKMLAKPRMRLPGVRIFREIVSPKRFFVVKDLRPLPCANSQHSDRQNANHGDRSLKFAAPAIGKHRHACANKRDERNVGKILKMVRNQRPTAKVSHSNEPNHWQERDHKISGGNKTAAQIAASEKPKQANQQNQRNQRQPLRQIKRLEAPTRKHRPSTARQKNFARVPPNRHSRVYETARNRNDYDFFFANPAILKPDRKSVV